jgi:TolB-like protein
LLYFFKDFVLDTDRRELRRGTHLVAIAPQAFDLLEYLIRNRERVISKDDLLASIWNGRIVSDSALSTRIHAARCAIDDMAEEQHLIRTLPRKGLRFIGLVREEHQPASSQESEKARAPEFPSPTLPLPEKPSIAVLPFANMSKDLEQDYFADGMAEEIITALSRCSWLFVIARNSSFTYKGKAVDVRQVGRELGVRYVLEGSVRRDCDRLRFTGQLIDTSSGGHIWADRFEGPADSVFELQDRFTEAVVAAIEPKLQQAEIERQKYKATSNLNAYDLYLRAQQCEYEYREESHAAALCYLEQALSIDPYYAPAMALAALCHSVRCFQGWMKNPDVEAREGVRLAYRAVDLGKENANIFWMAGHAILRLQMDLSRAREFVRHSLDLNPNSAMALAIAGEIESAVGNTREALELLCRAARLSPRDPRGWAITLHMAWAYLVAGRFDEAIAAAKKVLNQHPRSSFARRFIASSLARQGRLKEAAEALRQALEIEPVTLTRLRARLMFLDQVVWDDYAEGLRLAGLSE